VKPYERTDYFDGVLLVAEDLKREQTYYQGRLNSLARRAGPGVLEGFEVEENKERTGVRIAPGRAVDGCGRELVLEEPQYWPPHDECWPARGADEMFLCLQLDESHFLERVPALHSDARPEGASGDEQSVVVAYLETAPLRLVTENDLPWPGWRRAERVTEPENPVPSGSPDLIPIARLVRDPDSLCLKEVETLGRPIVTVREMSTHIIRLSWPHDGEFDLADALVLTFSRSLLDVPPPAAMQLTFEGRDGTLCCLGPSTSELAFVDEDRTRLRWSLRDRCSLLPADGLVRFRLACAFVLDEAGVPVSGAHLGGRLPTGNGIAGSDFESWFTVKRTAKVADPGEVSS
jgi:hypothetical protein